MSVTNSTFEMALDPVLIGKNFSNCQENKNEQNTT